ncbi:hypothetical protein I6A84_16515 [Frankia sp. CNm7]|nr:hypothetical protein [Frankia nepalensis]MBL7519657.1 hypothetical protein [Frankia nepalensis]
MDSADRVDWAVARFDGGDHAGAAVDLAACLDGWLPDEFAEAAPRILTGEQAVQVATAALGGEHPYRPFASGRNGPEDAVAGMLARLVAGNPDAEAALLRAVLMIRPDEYRGSPHRAARISAVFAALAEAHIGEPGYLDRWSALLDGDDQPCLAAAAALLGPLGLAETDRRCGTVRDVDGERLVAAFVAADRFDDALTLATRLGPSQQQLALLTLATPGLTPKRAKALVAAFRKCPKGDRSRDIQMIYHHRFARLFLALERVDDALVILSRLRDGRISGYGPDPLALEVLRWLDGRREAATPERLRAVLDVLASPGNIHQLAAVVADVVPLAHALADEQLRTEIVDVYVPRLRARLRDTGSRELLADAGLGAVIIETGDATALDPVYARAAGKRTDSRVSLVLAQLAGRTRLATRDRELFTRLVTATLWRGSWWIADALLPALDAEARAVVPDAVAAVPADRRRQVVAIARFAERVADSALLAAMLDAAPDAESTRRVAGRAAMVLARHGELPDALDVARRCGLVRKEPR